jgi:transcriptional regulator with XRE-family HTH domain
MMRLRGFIQAARAKRGHSIREAAESIRQSPTGVSKIERGLQTLSPRMAIALSTYTGQPALRLMEADAADRLDRYRAGRSQ